MDLKYVIKNYWYSQGLYIKIWICNIHYWFFSKSYTQKGVYIIIIFFLFTERENWWNRIKRLVNEAGRSSRAEAAESYRHWFTKGVCVSSTGRVYSWALDVTCPFNRGASRAETRVYYNSKYRCSVFNEIVQFMNFLYVIFSLYYYHELFRLFNYNHLVRAAFILHLMHLFSYH